MLFLTALAYGTISTRKHYLHSEVGFIMETKLERISQLSKENPSMVFTSVGHLINKEMLKSCHESMDGDKAVGVDGVTKADYEVNLDKNIDELVEKLKRRAYKPQPARRTEIRKPNGKMRPLSIYCYEDKLVQEALRRILEAVFEPHFYNEMMGFRPNRNCHQALRLLNSMIEHHNTSYVLDADIKGFFDNLDHEWIIKFVESRIKDPNITRLIRRMLKAGIMKDYRFDVEERGAGQGNVCAPILANIYMHYVLVWWFKEKIQPKLKGYSGLVVYADDFVICFQYKAEAETFYKQLKKRMGHFGLSLEEEKSRLIEFGRFAESNRARLGKPKPETFDYLGFTHYCSRSRNGRFRVKRKTSRKKFSHKSKEVHKSIGEMRTLPVKAVVKKINQILVGYYHYYGITDNSKAISAFRYRVLKSLYHWSNRRSQKKSYTWEGYLEMITKAYPIELPRIYVSIYG
jgi:group II intron reverse transcriptase/maturase